MQKIKSKLKNGGGFTLIEMLIVVAIIAILVAVSIPLVNTSLEKARVATDAANERAAKAVAVVKYLNEETTASVPLYYDAVSGDLLTDKSSIETYGKCEIHGGDIIQITVDAEGAYEATWVDKATGNSGGAAHGTTTD